MEYTLSAQTALLGSDNKFIHFFILNEPVVQIRALHRCLLYTICFENLNNTYKIEVLLSKTLKCLSTDLSSVEKQDIVETLKQDITEYYYCKGEIPLYCNKRELTELQYELIS